MLEKYVERKLVEGCKKKNWLCLKLFGYVGIPDRMILTDDGRMCFVELKAPGKKPRPEQLAFHTVLRKHNFVVKVIDNVDDVKSFLNEF